MEQDMQGTTAPGELPGEAYVIGLIAEPSFVIRTGNADIQLAVIRSSSSSASSCNDLQLSPPSVILFVTY